MPGKHRQSDAWNRVSSAYNDGRQIPHSVEYGPFSPLESELALLGDVRGLTVLDAGCGGGHNAVCLAKLGAIVTALDSSARQVEYTSELCNRADCDIDCRQGEVESLTGIRQDSFDLILCINVLPYIEDLKASILSFRRVLKREGRLVISLDHPLRYCFNEDDAGGLSNYPEKSYHAEQAYTWRFSGTLATMVSHHRTVSSYLNALTDCGFKIVEIHEPSVPRDILDDEFPLDGPLASLRNIPHTLILVATPALATEPETD